MTSSDWPFPVFVEISSSEWAISGVIDTSLSKVCRMNFSFLSMTPAIKLPPGESLSSKLFNIACMFPGPLSLFNSFMVDDILS